MRKIAQWCFGVYCLLCISPYFISALNTIEPKLYGIPFTVWSALLLVLAGCLLMFFFSKFVWDSYTGNEAVTGERGDVK
ncbi:hypothetical protein FACS1894204_03210 [Synergistales bacterium]|nr:hypothetical protein FACS1894204_03210 [Synergistales bacterium]